MKNYSLSILIIVSLISLITLVQTDLNLGNQNNPIFSSEYSIANTNAIDSLIPKDKANYVHKVRRPKSKSEYGLSNAKRINIGPDVATNEPRIPRPIPAGVSAKQVRLKAYKSPKTSGQLKLVNPSPTAKSATARAAVNE